MLADEALRSSPTAFIYTFAQTAPESSMCPAASQVLRTESQRNHGPHPERASTLGRKINAAVSVTVNGTGGNHNPDPPSACAGGTWGLSGAPRGLPGANWRHLVDGAWPHTWPSRSGPINTGPVALNLPPSGQSWT